MDGNLLTAYRIIAGMRYFFLACLIALLPMRGWLGDAMAMKAVNQVLHASAPAEMMQDHHMPASTGTLSDCPGHAAGLDSAGGTSQHADTHASGADCASCTFCQICHGAALAFLPVLAEPEAPAAGSLPASIAHFSSAERILGFKPPIS